MPNFGLSNEFPEYHNGLVKLGDHEYIKHE